MTKKRLFPYLAR